MSEIRFIEDNSPASYGDLREAKEELLAKINELKEELDTLLTWSREGKK